MNEPWHDGWTASLRLGRADILFGASLGADGTTFGVWAPAASAITLVLETGPASGEHALRPAGGGWFQDAVPGARAGDRYRYRIDGGPLLPDPASRYQPEGVHGPSEIVDPAFAWSDAAWRGVDPDDLVIYELHVGTFTAEGTFASALSRFPYLRDLGVTAIELMPLSDFPGARNWGYDGVCLYAPARPYGHPDDLRRLVDAAHAHGLAVLLDVVYNHLGPDGAYLGAFSPAFFSTRHVSPWGPGINLDGPGSEYVRAFLIQNARHWIDEYHVDGFRIDATHALQDDSPVHFLDELTATLHACGGDRRIIITAEDHRNLANMILDRGQRGWGMDGIWADDFHHEMRRMLAGDDDGYFMDYAGTSEEIAETIRRGWFYRGQPSAFFGGTRGTDPSAVPPRRFVCFIQNHDQVGNRAFGDRLHHRIDLAAYRAASALLLTMPETPLLFMGQEWAASSPFLFFTDHNADLGQIIREGRRKEFARFVDFAVDRLPDAQDDETFAVSHLRWDEIGGGDHARTLALYRALLALRRSEPALVSAARSGFDAWAVDDGTVAIRREALDGSSVLIVARLKGSGTVDVGVRAEGAQDRGYGGGWQVVLTTEETPFAHDPAPPLVDLGGGVPRIEFTRPSAVILRRS